MCNGKHSLTMTPSSSPFCLLPLPPLPVSESLPTSKLMPKCLKKKVLSQLYKRYGKLTLLVLRV